MRRSTFSAAYLVNNLTMSLVSNTFKPMRQSMDLLLWSVPTTRTAVCNRRTLRVCGLQQLSCAATNSSTANQMHQLKMKRRNYSDRTTKIAAPIQHRSLSNNTQSPTSTHPPGYMVQGFSKIAAEARGPLRAPTQRLGVAIFDSLLREY